MKGDADPNSSQTSGKHNKLKNKNTEKASFSEDDQVIDMEVQNNDEFPIDEDLDKSDGDQTQTESSDGDNDDPAEETHNTDSPVDNNDGTGHNSDASLRSQGSSRKRRRRNIISVIGRKARLI